MLEANPAHFKAVDALRGWAILAVIVLHVATLSPPPDWLVPLTHEGVRGVQLFFVLSAFALCSSFHERQGETRALLAYFIRRFFRIAPMFYLAALCWVLYQTMVLGAAAPSPSILLSNLTFTSAWHFGAIHALVPGGWSIAVEMNFYVLLPAVLLFARDFRSAAWVCGAVAALGTAAGVAGYLVAPRFWTGEELVAARGYFAGFWLPISLVPFMGGVLAYYAFAENRLRLMRPRLAGAAVLAAIVVISYAHMPLKNVAMVPCFVALLLLSLRNPGPIVVNKITETMGVLSYSAYFTHFAVLEVLERWLPAGLQRFEIVLVLCVPASFAVAAMTYQAIEQPGRALGRRLVRMLPRPAQFPSDGPGKSYSR